MEDSQGPAKPFLNLLNSFIDDFRNARITRRVYYV
jgi:hypothetical protein